MTRRFAVGCLLLFALAGSAMAQIDSLFVIKKTVYRLVGDEYVLDETNHYLAHVKVGGVWRLQDADSFSPACLWYSGREHNVSGTNHNYYFIDDDHEYRFLSAPLEAGGSLGLSDSEPEIYVLNNTDHNYYFYDWDYDNWPDGAGVARGHQHTGETSETCTCDWRDDECWEVYWVEYYNDAWQLSSSCHYDIDNNGGRFRMVTHVEHPMVISSGSGGLTDLSVPQEMEWGDDPETLSATVGSYTYTYTPGYIKYDFDDVTHPGNSQANPPIPPTTEHYTYYYCNGNTTTTFPDLTPQTNTNAPVVSYNWSLSGPGASHLTLTDANTATPTLTYTTENVEFHKLATVTLTVTYSGGAMQSMSENVLVKTSCKNPTQSAEPVVTENQAIVSWIPTDVSYTVSWRAVGDTEWTSASASGVTYPITGLEPNTNYQYKVKADCTPDSEPVPVYTFRTNAIPMVNGAVFGGGRMANVGGKTEVVIINTDGIGAVYGGNDIAGSVLGDEGSTVVLGINSNDPNYGTYNSNDPSTNVRVGDVYGGGNGFYLYNAEQFHGATASNITLPNGATVKDLEGHTVWTNETGSDYVMTIPTIVKTDITLNTNLVKVDSIFGGAKNAFITNEDDDDGTSITINGGTAFAVFGGNNYGGNQTAGKHKIAVTNTKPNTSNYPTGLGTDYGIGYVFGGGNRVEGLTAEVTITGGMCDTVFAGGNAADVLKADVLVNCAIGAGSSSHYGSIYSNAIQSYSDNTLTIKETGYDWNGTGIYNVRTLFGGNNRADMNGLPTITLNSGSLGTVYGGGNSGQMLAQIADDDDPDNNPGTGPIATAFGSNYIGEVPLPIYYGTHVVMDQPNVIVDYLYGGCQMSNVAYSTWVEVQNGHVGTVYGGCNIGGDVGSTRREFPGVSPLTKEHKQATFGATYVIATGGTIYGDLFAGANGYYHCNDGIKYIEGLNFVPGHFYINKIIPSHNETHVKVSKTDETYATVKGNVYAGGNMAYVGFINANASVNGRYFPELRGLASVLMDGGVVEGSVYGGGNRASVFGSNEVKVSGGSIGYDAEGTLLGGALYGGNDRAGQVAQITNRVFPSVNNYDVASDGLTSLTQIGVKTYVGITGKPKVNTVYGGGNGAYEYTPEEYCDITDQPVQSNTFVDVNIDADGGSGSGGYINEVYGGGNGVTVLDRITVFVNVENATDYPYNQIGTLYGGNNKGDLDILSNVFLVHGQLHTVYGGCNSGAMTGSFNTNGYYNVGSMVHVPSEYQPIGTDPSQVDPTVCTAKVTGYIYGGCKSANVDHNTLVLVESGEHTATLFGGCDISGDVGGNSQVIVTGCQVGEVFGGGNGSYDYINNYPGLQPPYCDQTHVEMLNNSQCLGNVFGGGYAGECGDTYLLVDGCDIDGGIYGGGNMAGVVISSYIDETNPEQPVTVYTSSGCSTIEMSNGSVATGVYGGCNLTGDIEGEVDIIITGGSIGTESDDAYIFGGGYGEDTRVAKNITIEFGEADVEASAYPKLYGELYGGSALGNTNTATNADHPYTTHININNGTIEGNVFGGGLGYKDENNTANDVAAMVYGKIYLQIGKAYSGGVFHGEATLSACSVFGCNNQNGSPQDDVYVDVYKTAHINGVNTVDDDGYAIDNVFGGGNESHYAPENGEPLSEKKTHVYIHGCDNTINYVYGGGNAANSVGVNTIIEGGHFNEVYGGGNGWNVPAHIGKGGIGLAFLAGHVNYYIVGSNKQGDNEGGIYAPSLPASSITCPGGLIVDSYYVGTNQAEIYHDLITTIACDPDNEFNYKYVYGGSRWATVYGDIKLTVQGGKIEKLFGGSKGDYHPNAPEENKPAHVRRFPSQEEIAAMDLIDPTYYSTGLREYVQEHPEVIGHGGNIVLTITGGSIIDVYGGCDKLGNVDGKITVLVNENDDACGLNIGNIYGASNETNYVPINAGIKSPQVTVLKGAVGEFDFNNNGSIGNDEKYDGNVFGGAHHGTITCNPVVVIGEHSNTNPVTIKGSVFGGGDMGDLNGSTEVIVIPVTNEITIIPPASESGHALVVTDVNGNAVHSGDAIDEYADLKIVALPNIYGYKFVSWAVENGTLEYSNEASTIFTMGQADASIEAVFGTAAVHNFKYSQPSHGSVTVTDGQNQTVYTDVNISEGAVLNIVAAVTSNDYVFSHWVITATNPETGTGGARVSNSLLSTATFTMGTKDVTLSAVIVPSHVLTFNATNGQITATDALGNAVTSGASIGEGAVIDIMATPDPGYKFVEWTVVSEHGEGGTVENPAVSSTKFTMGTENATLRAIFESTGRNNNNRNSER